MGTKEGVKVRANVKEKKRSRGCIFRFLFMHNAQSTIPFFSLLLFSVVGVLFILLTLVTSFFGGPFTPQ